MAHEQRRTINFGGFWPGRPKDLYKYNHTACGERYIDTIYISTSYHTTCPTARTARYFRDHLTPCSLDFLCSPSGGGSTVRHGRQRVGVPTQHPRGVLREALRVHQVPPRRREVGVAPTAQTEPTGSTPLGLALGDHRGRVRGAGDAHVGAHGRCGKRRPVQQQVVPVRRGVGELQAERAVGRAGVPPIVVTQCCSLVCIWMQPRWRASCALAFLCRKQGLAHRSSARIEGRPASFTSAGGCLRLTQAPRAGQPHASATQPPCAALARPHGLAAQRPRPG